MSTEFGKTDNQDLITPKTQTELRLVEKKTSSAMTPQQLMQSRFNNQPITSFQRVISKNNAYVRRKVQSSMASPERRKLYEKVKILEQKEGLSLKSENENAFRKQQIDNATNKIGNFLNMLNET